MTDQERMITHYDGDECQPPHRARLAPENPCCEEIGKYGKHSHAVPPAPEPRVRRINGTWEHQYATEGWHRLTQDCLEEPILSDILDEIHQLGRAEMEAKMCDALHTAYQIDMPEAIEKARAEMLAEYGEATPTDVKDMAYVVQGRRQGRLASRQGWEISLMAREVLRKMEERDAGQ